MREESTHGDRRLYLLYPLRKPIPRPRGQPRGGGSGISEVLWESTPANVGSDQRGKENRHGDEMKWTNYLPTTGTGIVCELIQFLRGEEYFAWPVDR